MPGDIAQPAVAGGSWPADVGSSHRHLRRRAAALRMVVAGPPEPPPGFVGGGVARRGRDVPDAESLGTFVELTHLVGALQAPSFWSTS